MNLRDQFIIEKIAEGQKIPIPIGSILKNQEYAETLKRIASLGAEEFYEGKTAQLIIESLKKSDENSLMSLDDLKKLRSNMARTALSNVSIL